MARSFYLPAACKFPLRLAPVRCSVEPGRHRATLNVAGEAIWFESPDLSLTESVEAIGSAFLIPAAAVRRRLSFASPPEPVWLSNARNAERIAAEWWGYGQALPPARTPSVERTPVNSAAPRRTALCFAGGVDSFYSLICGEQRVDHLMFVHGFDVALADIRRANTAEASLRAVAAARGQPAILVRTNLRTHRLFRRANWEHAHGGALAAVGHLLSDHVNQLLISASYPRVFDRPWGSHWALDPWWSSSRLTVTHVGAEKWRAEKLVAIMNEPLVRQHLRVCWENRSPTGNCGQCEKCLRTMLVLDGHGCLGEFPVFPAASLAANLDQLPNLKPDLIRVYAGFLELALSARVRAALTGLLIRSGSQPASGESRRAQDV